MRQLTRVVFAGHLIVLSLLLCCVIPLHGQTLSSPGADRSSRVSRLNPASKDSLVQVFIVHSPDPSMPEELMLSAGDIEPSATFEWYRFDTLDFSFHPYYIETGVQASTVTGLEAGGYRVHVSSAATDTLLTAWIFANSPEVSVTKDEEGKVNIYQRTCDYLMLMGEARADTMRYYDFSAGKMKTIPNGMAFEWTSDDPGYEFFGRTRYLNLYIYNVPDPVNNSRPPTSDTWFTLTAVDSFGLELSDRVLYESIHVKAGFSVMIEDEENPGIWIEEESPKGEAPLEVKFINESENGEEFYWTFIDSAKTGSFEADTTFDAGDTARFTYYIPQNYFPSLTAVSWAGCLDSFKMADPIYVEDSELKIPNVFTPDGDGTNDYFAVHAKSLKEFRVTIFNRWGNLVYEHVQTGDKFGWKGWDGTLQGKGSHHCAPGVYFYVVEAIGWDQEKYRGKAERGFVYLYRNR